MKQRFLPTMLATALFTASLVGYMPAGLAADGDPVFKSDTPKLDSPPQKQTLRGGIQHSEATAAPKSSKLTTGASSNSASAHVQEPKLSAGTPKSGSLINKLLKSKTKKSAPIPLQVETQTESGVGIIGVRFVSGFGRPPIINRVFPGTPAQTGGLRVNDIIVAVDGIPTRGLRKEEVYAMIVGTPDTTVTISVVRGGDFIARTMNRMDFNDIPDPNVKRDYMQSL